jgi:DNA gyrase subunit A
MVESLLSGRVEPVDIQDEIQRSYLDYAMSVIVGRALPMVEDGLKPVQRRILWSMLEGGLRPDRPHRKSANVVGGVMAKYHPHGDQAIYDALARMAQNWSLRAPLVDGHGNFGSPEGDPPAAQRYTEARLSVMAMELLRDIDAETVDFIPNYDGYEQEPVLLPARFPNLLVNGAGGIAVGMATNIPPHNLGEVIDAVIAQIDDPNISIAGLMKHVKGPDFPTGAAIVGRQGIKEAYETGRGSLRMRGVTQIEETRQGTQRLVITEVPYQVNPASLLTKVAELRKDGKIKDIATDSAAKQSIRNESGKQGMRLVVELRRGANPHVVLNQLYKHTQLQETFGVIMLSIVDGVPLVLDLKSMLGHYIDHQVDVVTRRTRYQLRKAEERDHIVQGLLIALQNLDAVIKIIRGSQDSEEARTKLMQRFKLSEIQANHILDMPLRRLTRLARAELEQEHKDLLARIKYLNSLLKDPKKIFGVIKEELIEIKQKHADPRRTQLKADEGDLDIEDLVADEDVIITVSRGGYVKRVPVETYRRQGRGGRGVRGATLKEEDVVKHVFTTTTKHWLLFFTSKGKVYRVKVWDVAEGSRTARGMFAANLPGVVVSADEKVSAVMDLKDYQEGKFLVFATKKGMVKRTALTEYDSPRTGLAAINLKPGDELVEVLLTDGKGDLMLISSAGLAARFSQAAARPMGRQTAGVIGMRLTPGAEVLAMVDATSGEDLITVTENGFGKRTAIEQYPRKGRPTKGVAVHKLTKRTGGLSGAFVGSKDQDMFVISSSGIVIRVQPAQIRRVGRASQGVRTMRVEEGARVVALSPVVMQAQAEEAGQAEASAEAEDEPVEDLELRSPGAGPPSRNATSRSDTLGDATTEKARRSRKAAAAPKASARRKTSTAKTATAQKTRKATPRTAKTSTPQRAKKATVRKGMTATARKAAAARKAATSAKKTSARKAAGRSGTSRTTQRRRRS